MHTFDQGTLTKVRGGEEQQKKAAEDVAERGLVSLGMIQEV